MKTFITLIFFLFVILFDRGTILCQNGWFTVSSPRNAWLEDVQIVNPGAIYIVGLGYTVLKSTDLGNTWSIQFSGANYHDLYSTSFINAITGYAVGGYDSLNTNYGEIFKTTNGGINWNLIFTNHSTPVYKTISKIDNLKAITSSAFITQITTDGGNNWNNVGETLFFINKFCFLDPFTGYGVGGSPSQCFKTTNGGLNWAALSLGTLPSNTVLKSVSFPNFNTGYVIGSGSNQVFVLKTVNSGANWSTVAYLSNIDLLYSILALNSDTAYITGKYGLGDYGRIFRTIDGGQTWSLQYSGGTYTDPYSISFLNNMTGFAVGPVGLILKTTTGGENPNGLVREVGTVPETIIVYQNYPNPFNPLTKIKFDLPKSSFTKLIIYDILGREVVTLVNQELKTGSYECVWDANNYPSGIYLYKLISGDFQETKKVILLK